MLVSPVGPIAQVFDRLGLAVLLLASIVALALRDTSDLQRAATSSVGAFHRVPNGPLAFVAGAIRFAGGERAESQG